MFTKRQRGVSHRDVIAFAALCFVLQGPNPSPAERGQPEGREPGQSLRNISR
jgi:hypothetical protein